MTDKPIVNPDDPSDPQSLLSERHRRADFRMIERALKQKWNLPDAVFEAIPKEAIRIIADKNIPVRDRNAAMRVLVQMHGQNIGDGQVNIEQINQSVVAQSGAIDWDALYTQPKDVIEVLAQEAPQHASTLPGVRPNGKNGQTGDNGRGL